MKCPNCGGEMTGTGFTCAGADLYHCPGCDEKWEIKNRKDEWNES